MTCDLVRNFIFTGFLSLFFFVISPTKVLSQSDLIVEGNVLGYELHGIKPFGCCIIWINYEYPLLVKITKAAEGEEKSEYIIVLLKYLNKDDAENNFGINKTTTFKLVRKINYFLKPKDLLRRGFVIKNGKFEKGRTFTFVPEIDKKDLPLNKKIPVYVEVERNN